MPMEAMTTKSGMNYGVKPDTPTAPNAKTGEETQEAASLNSGSQETLMRAQQSALEAKEAALGAISRFYQESKASEIKTGKMLGELEEALQLAVSAVKKPRGVNGKEASIQSGQSATVPHEKKNTKSARKVLHPGPFGIVSDLTKSLFGVQSTTDEVREEFYRVVMRRSPQLRQLIDDLTEEKSRVKTEKIIAEAKSEIAAARVAVGKAQQELNAAREETKKARLESENADKAPSTDAGSVEPETVSGDVETPEEKIKQNDDETAVLESDKRAALNLAEVKVKKEAEELRSLRVQAMVAVKRAQDQEKKAKAEAEAISLEARQAIEKAAAESQQAKDDIEAARKAIENASVIAEKLAYDKFLDEIRKIREEVDITNRKAREAIARAGSETKKAKRELEAVKKASEKELDTARRVTLEAQNEAEKVKKAMFEIINQSQESNRKVQQEAEASVKQATESMMQAKQDIVNMTRNEIIKSRQEFEEPHKAVKSDEATTARPSIGKQDAGDVDAVLHEIRNPLHSISGFAKLLKEDDISDTATRNEFLSLMEQQTENLNKLFDDLSNVLNNKSGALSIEKEPVSSQKIIKESIDSVKTLVQQKKNLIQTELAPDLPEINADPSRVKQVITNLLTNAVKFSPENSPIWVKAGINDNELLVQVIDHGIGIPEAEITAVFNKHHRAANGGDVEGEGLGLYICRQIIENCGGRIWAESVEGEGSSFCFSLPLCAAVPQENNHTGKNHAE